MKNLMYIFIIGLLTLTGTLFSQEETNPSSQVEDSVTKQDTQSQSDLKTKKFGSKEHRDSIGLTANKNSESGDLMLKTCLSLAAVIGLIVLIFYILKKVNSRIYTNGKSNPLRVFSRLPLDNKNYLTLVRAYEEEFLLSVGPNGTTVIARYALIDQDKDDNDDSITLNPEGKMPFMIDEDTHITSINLKPLNEQKNEKS